MLSCLFTIILTTPSTMQHFLECTDLFQDSSSSHSIQIVREKERELGRCNQINTNPIKFKHSHSLAKNCQMANQILEREILGRKKGVLETEFCSMKPSVFISVCLPSELCCLQLSHFTYDTINCATTNLFSLPRKFFRGEDGGEKKSEKSCSWSNQFLRQFSFCLET